MEHPEATYKSTHDSLHDWQLRCDPRLARFATMGLDRFEGLADHAWRDAFRNREAARAALRMPMLSLPSMDRVLSGPTECLAAGTSVDDGVLWLDLLVHTSDRVSLEELRVADPVAITGPDGEPRFLMVRVPADQVSTLAALRGVERLSLARPLAVSAGRPEQQQQSDDTVEDDGAKTGSARAPSKPAQQAPREALDAFIGVVDYAFDLLHPDLCWSVGYDKGWPAYQAGPGGRRSKVRAMYYPLDRVEVPEVAPEQELTRWTAQATTQSPTFESYRQLQHLPVGELDCIDEHGTMCAWVAAGRHNCIQGPGTGAAPDAELLLAAFNGKGRPAPGSRMPSSNDLLRALAWMDEKAGSRPLAINISLATHFGPHDGTSDDVVAIDGLAHKKGRAVVVAAGNDNLAGRHVQLDLKPGARGQLHWKVDEAQEPFEKGVEPVRPTTPDRMQVWGRNCAGLRMWFVGPGSSKLIELPIDHSGVIDVKQGGRHTILHWDNRSSWPGNGDPLFELSWTQLDGSALPLGDWKLLVEAAPDKAAAGPPRVDAWLGINDMACITWVRPQASKGHSTLSDLATGHHSIVVGNAQFGQTWEDEDRPPHDMPRVWLNPTSGRGPTRDGRTPTGFAAHGTLVRVPCARNRTNGKHFPVELSRFATGTSVAAPHVTGLAAQVLHEHPHLDSLGVAAELEKQARPVSTNPGWGKGFLP